MNLNFEDDVMLHNQLLKQVQDMICSRVVNNTYELTDSMNAIKAIAMLIKTKADKEAAQVINTPIEIVE